MRCRKVRSYLSAYCNGELSSRLKPAVSEHLSTCVACRREEAVYRSIAQATRELDSLKVSEEFNSKLFNRIARERFAETRTKAYLTRRAPVFLWRQIIPAFVVTCTVAVLAIVTFLPDWHKPSDPGSVSYSKLDNSYLTVQPIHNVKRTANLDKNWSLGNELARAERMNRLSSAIIQKGVWHNLDRSYGLTATSSGSLTPTPYVPGYYKVRPVIKIYMSPESPSAKEGRRVY